MIQWGWDTWEWFYSGTKVNYLILYSKSFFLFISKDPIDFYFFMKIFPFFVDFKTPYRSIDINPFSFFLVLCTLKWFNIISDIKMIRRHSNINGLHCYCQIRRLFKSLNLHVPFKFHVRLEIFIWMTMQTRQFIESRYFLRMLTKHKSGLWCFNSTIRRDITWTRG